MPLGRGGRLIDQIRTGAYVDLHTADNLVLPCSLAAGTSSFTVSKLTMHTLTAVEVAKNITGAKIVVEGSEGKLGRITVEGRGITNHHFTDQV
jgi:RNA 3'-terminal phosphate cyclase (ATP)